jgi:hypothetical protein
MVLSGGDGHSDMEHRIDHLHNDNSYRVSVMQYASKRGGTYWRRDAPWGRLIMLPVLVKPVLRSLGWMTGQRLALVSLSASRLRHP